MLQLTCVTRQCCPIILPPFYVATVAHRSRAGQLKCEQGLGWTGKLAMPVNVLICIERNVRELLYTRRARKVGQRGGVDSVACIEPIQCKGTQGCLTQAQRREEHIKLACFHAEVNCPELNNS